MKNFPKNHRQSLKGFTIAEMLIVTIILGVLMGIGTRTYYRERDRYQFNNALIKMMELIKTTRNFATTSHPVYVGGSTTPMIPKDGYGVYISLDPDIAAGEPHFTIFANTSAGASDYFDKTDDVILEEYQLPRQIEFQSFYLDGSVRTDSGTDPNEIHTVILFKPPLAEASIHENIGTPFNELRLKFFNQAAPDESAKQCQYIHMNAVKGFPEITYDSCP